MAITRTAKGTQSANGSATCTVSSVAIAQGASVVVFIGRPNRVVSPYTAPSSVTWNGLALTQEHYQDNHGNAIEGWVYAKHGCTAATGNVVVTFPAGNADTIVCSVVELASDRTGVVGRLVAHDGKNATSTNTTLDTGVPAVVDDMVLSCAVEVDQGSFTGTLSGTTGQTIGFASANAIVLRDSYTTGAGAGIAASLTGAGTINGVLMSLEYSWGPFYAAKNNEVVDSGGSWTVGTTASYTFAAGASIVVGLHYDNGHDHATSIVWNGQSLQRAVQVVGASETLEIWSLHAVAGASSAFTITFAAGSGPVRFTASQITWAARGGQLDQVHSGSGNSSSPSSGATAATLCPSEVAVGLAAITGAGGAGTWANSFVRAQTLSDGDADFDLDEGYKVVNATGAQTAAETGASSGPWLAVCATFREISQISTPASVNMTATANQGTTAVVAVPPSVEMFLSAPGGKTNVLARPASVPMFLSAPEQPDAGLVPDSYTPTTVSTIAASAVLRATTPPELGDAEVATNGGDGTGSTTLPAASGVRQMGATVFQQVPPEHQVGTIDYIVLRAIAWIADVGPYFGIIDGTWPGSPATRFAYRVGAGSVAESAAVNDDPAVGTGYVGDGLGGPPIPSVGFVLRKFSDIFDPGDDVHLSTFVHSGPIATKPGGGAWTWADLNNLTLGAIRYSWSGASPPLDFADLTIGEIWVEVYQAIGSLSPPIRVVARAGNVRDHVTALSSIGG